MSDSVRPHRQQPTRLPHPWDSPGKNTGVGCHFLLQCMKVKSESEVTHSCPTPSYPMDCSPPGSSIHRIFQARVLEWVAKQSIFLLVILHIFPIFHYDTALEEKFPFPLFSYFWKIFYCSPQGQEIEVHIL